MENALIKHRFHVKKITGTEQVWIPVYDTPLFELYYAITKGIISIRLNDTHNK